MKSKTTKAAGKASLRPLVVRCRCCHKPSTDANGRPKRITICWDCIRHGGSIERNCSRFPHNKVLCQPPT